MPDASGSTHPDTDYRAVMPFLEAAEGVRLHYVEHGAGDAARTAVLLHGFAPDQRLMVGCFERVFADRTGWRRLYLDLPGMGRTAAPEWLSSTDDVFEVVCAAVDALAGDRFVVCGESYGGYLARGLVTRMPARVAGMALLCPMVVAPHAERDRPGHTVLVRDEFCARLPPESEFGRFAVVQTEETYRRTRSEVLSGAAIADLAALRRIRRGGWAGSFPLEGRTARYEVPVLFVLGRQDSDTCYRDAWGILEHYPRATYAVLDRAGHNLQIEQPVLFEALVSEWLDRVEEHLSAG